MKWWFRDKKPILKPKKEANSRDESTFNDFNNQSQPKLFGEKLVMIHRQWENFISVQDSIPGIKSYTAHGFDPIANMIGIILNDSTAYFGHYADTPAYPNTVFVRGQKIGDIGVSLQKDGILFDYKEGAYYSSTNYAVSKMLEVLDYFWSTEVFTFVYGISFGSPILKRKEYYLSGPKSNPQRIYTFLVATSTKTDSHSTFITEPTIIDIELLWANGETYITRLNSGYNKLEITRIK